MVKVATPGVIRGTLAGSEDGSIVRENCSSSSPTLSSFMATLNETLITPAGIVTLYGPEV